MHRQIRELKKSRKPSVPLIEVLSFRQQKVYFFTLSRTACKTVIISVSSTSGFMFYLLGIRVFCSMLKSAELKSDK